MSDLRERAIVHERHQRQVVDLVMAVFVHHDLPKTVHAVVTDKESGKKFSALIGVDSTKDKEGANVIVKRGGELHPELSMTDIADMTLEKPGIPIVCDLQCLDEFPREGFFEVRDDNAGHYRVERPNGAIDVYSALQA